MAGVILATLFFYQLRIVRQNIKAQVTNTTHMKRDYPMHLVERSFKILKGTYTLYADRQPIHIHLFASQVSIRKDYLDVSIYGVFVYPRFFPKQSPNDSLTL